MTEGKAIYNLLRTDDDITNLVSSRIYPQIASQGADFPFIVYLLVDVDPSDTKSGVSTLDQSRYDIVVASKTYSEVSTITELVRNRLDRYSGTVESVVIDSIQFQSVDADNDPATETYVTSSEYIIRIKR